MSQNINFRNPIIMALIMAIGMFLGYKMKGSLRYNDQQTKTSNLGEIMQLVQQKYVDNVGADTIEAKAIEQLLSQLDPHSVYIPPKDLQDVDDDLDGDFDGIGIEFFFQKDTLVVGSVLSGGPSEAAGLNTGDQIFKVNDSIISGKKASNDGVIKLLRGVSGSKVKVSVLRNHNLVKVFNITRGKIPMYSLDASYLLDAQTGYIKINRFAATTYDEFVKAVKDLKQKGMSRMIIDVRDNPGGYLDAAVKIADELISGKRKIVYTKGRTSDEQAYYSEKKGLFEEGKVVVLIDEGSASAAEILSGAIQDYDRGTIIGRRSFGKGLVQEQYPLSNGGALRLTVARYYIPSGRCIQKDYSNGVNKYEEDVYNRFKSGELTTKDSVKQSDTTFYKTLGGRRVFGGGGITPDVFVALDTNKYSRGLSDVLSSGLIIEVSNTFYLENKEELKKYKSVADLNSQLKLPVTILNNLKEKCAIEKITLAPFAKKTDLDFISMRIKAQIAKYVFGPTAIYEVSNSNDEVILEALKHFN
jgi:carboxyl-terminal processing protease